MKVKIPPAVGIVVVIVVVVVALFFGFRTVSGGPDADTTQSVINHYNPGGAKSGK